MSDENDLKSDDGGREEGDDKQYEDFDPFAPSLGSQNPETISREVKSTMDMDTVKLMQGFVERYRTRQNSTRTILNAWMGITKTPMEKMCPLGGQNHRLASRNLWLQFWHDEPGEPTARYVLCPTCLDKSRGEVNGPLYEMGVPTQLLDATFDNWKIRTQEDEDILRACRDYAQHPVGILILTGKVGLGKSHLAVAILRTVNEKRMLMVTQTRLLRMLRDTYKNKNAPNPVTLCARMKDLLVLDELGLTSGGKDEYGEIYDIVGHCYDYRTPLVITTNVPSSQFQNAFGDRIADRLSTGKTIPLTGTSWR